MINKADETRLPGRGGARQASRDGDLTDLTGLSETGGGTVPGEGHDY
jgi:hypothetical protein